MALRQTLQRLGGHLNFMPGQQRCPGTLFHPPPIGRRLPHPDARCQTRKNRSIFSLVRNGPPQPLSRFAALASAALMPNVGLFLFFLLS